MSGSGTFTTYSSLDPLSSNIAHIHREHHRGMVDYGKLQPKATTLTKLFGDSTPSKLMANSTCAGMHNTIENAQFSEHANCKQKAGETQQPC